MRLLLDMNLSPDWVAFLNKAGVEALHWSSVGRANAPDTEVMNWARAHDCIVFTNDLDYSALLATTRAVGPSVLQLRTQDLLPDSAGAIVLQVLRMHAEPLEKGAIVSVASDGARVRVLPLSSEPA